MKLQKLLKQAEDSIFDEIIQACEKKMAFPFKKEESLVEVEPEAEPEMEHDSSLSEDDIETLKKLLE